MQVTLMTIVWLIIIFGIVVLSHEFGHAIIAKANGIRVVEFSVGMGPKNFFCKAEGYGICPAAASHRRCLYV